MGWGGTLRVPRAETWLAVYRTIAIAKLARLGPAKNDTAPEFSRVNNVLKDDFQENPQKTLSSVYRRSIWM